MSAAIDATSRFEALVEQRRAIGVRKHAPAYLDGPCLLLPLALEAIDASNYAAMELERLHVQYPAASDAQCAVKALGLCSALFADAAARALSRATGQTLDVGATAHERANGPAAVQYGFEDFLYRDNYAEAVEELADAAILARFELRRRRHQDAGDTLDREIERLGQIATALAHAILDVASDVLPTAPPPARDAAQAA